MSEINLSSDIGKNVIINPLLDLSQRNTSFIGVVSDDYTLDRFVYTKTGTMVHDIFRDLDHPNSLGVYSLKSNCTSAQASITATDFVKIEQRIEGYNSRVLMGNDVVLSFWVKATKIGVYCVSFGNENSDRSYVSEYQINVANTWEKKTIRIKHDETGIWNKLSGTGLRVIWTIAAGTNFQTVNNSWAGGEFYATSNQVNGCDAINNEFKITQIQVHEGIDETDFKNQIRDFGKELQLSQRYFTKTYNLDVAPGAINQAGQFHGRNLGSGSASTDIEFPVRMRIPPVVIVYASSGLINNWREQGSNIDRIIATIGSSEYLALLTFSAATVGATLTGHYTANSEL